MRIIWFAVNQETPQLRFFGKHQEKKIPRGEVRRILYSVIDLALGFD
jgi:hypothetical protein